jgi:hypothetical protein
MHQVATFLWMKQWTGKAKTGTGEGRPKGVYGKAYAARRKHALQTHPDWSDGHRHSDALRVMMKAFLKDLLLAWRAAETVEMPNAETRAALKEREAGGGKVYRDSGRQIVDAVLQE